MADWQSVREHLRSNFKIEEVNDSLLKLLFTFEDGRSQFVFVTRTGNDAWGEWVRVEAPIGSWADVHLPKALELIEDAVCGGLGRVAEFVTIRDSFPIDDLSIEELEKPMMLVAAIGDDLESKLVGGDRF